MPTCKATLLKPHFGMRVLPITLLHIFTTLFPKNVSGGLLLYILTSINLCIRSLDKILLLP